MEQEKLPEEEEREPEMEEEWSGRGPMVTLVALVAVIISIAWFMLSSPA